MSGTLPAKHRKRLAEVATRRKSKKISRRALLKFCRKHIVIHQALAQQAKTPASKGCPQADKIIYFASSNGEIHTTASSKSENVDLHPAEPNTSSYSGYNHLHGFTTSFADAVADQLNIQVPF